MTDLTKSADPQWLQSPWQPREVHAFREVGEGAASATAVCTHSAPSDRLSVPERGARRCLKCLLTLGGDLFRETFVD